MTDIKLARLKRDVLHVLANADPRNRITDPQARIARFLHAAEQVAIHEALDQVAKGETEALKAEGRRAFKDVDAKQREIYERDAGYLMKIATGVLP